MDPYTVRPNSIAETFDQPAFDRGYHSSAQAESDQFFGVQNGNHYHQDVRRALEERSVNAQYEAYATYTASAYEKVAASHPETGPLEYPLDSVPYLRGWSPALEKEFRIFWHRVWRCTAFREYRTSPPKPDRVAKDEDKKWTSLREEMFFRASCKYFPVGRKKDTYSVHNKEKQMGRNEKLAECINEWLDLQDPKDPANEGIVIPVENQALGRKQISSHLQVLKVKFKEDTWINLMYLGGDLASKGHRPRLGLVRSTTHGRGVRALPLSSRAEASRHALASQVRPLPLARPPTLLSQPVSSALQCFLEPSDFWMYLRRPCDRKTLPDHICASGDSCNYKRLHTFTKTQHNVRDPDTSLESGPHLAGTFPELAHGQSCPVLYASATIALPSEPIRLGSQELELSIDSTFTTAVPLDHNTSWQVKTRFFEGGKPASWYVHDEETTFAWQDVAVDRVGDRGQYTHKVPFGSSYWVGKVQKLFKWHETAHNASVRSYNGVGSDGRPTLKTAACKDPREYYDSIRHDIGTTTAVQEIFARGQDECATRCCLIIYWRFTQTAYPDEVGTTVFRNLHVIKQDQDIAPQHQLNIHLHQGRMPIANGVYPDPRAYDLQYSNQSSSHSLDALASLATSDVDLFSNIDWSAMDSFGIDDMSAQTLAGAEAFSSAVTMPSVAYSLPPYEAGYAIEQAYDPSLVSLHDQTPADVHSSSQSSVHSPRHDMTIDNDQFAGDSSNESQPSTAASSYMTSAQFTPASFASQQELSQKNMTQFGQGFGVYNNNRAYQAEDGSEYDQTPSYGYYNQHQHPQAIGQTDAFSLPEQAQQWRSLRWTRGYQAHHSPQHVQKQMQQNSPHHFNDGTIQHRDPGHSQRLSQPRHQHHNNIPAHSFEQLQNEAYSYRPSHAGVNHQYNAYGQDSQQGFTQTQEQDQGAGQQQPFNNSPDQAYSQGQDQQSQLEDSSQSLRFDANWSQETHDTAYSQEQQHDDGHTDAGAVIEPLYDANFFAGNSTGSGIIWEE